MMDQILENRRIAAVAGRFLRPPHRLNGLHESDAELIWLDPGFDRILAITTDALSEEISSGLYAEPCRAGWMLAMANFSDLAAVGADPLGLVVTITCPPSPGEGFLEGLADGISAACKTIGTYVLGGDTNQGERTFLSGCAVGLVPKAAVLTRRGSAPAIRSTQRRRGLGRRLRLAPFWAPHPPSSSMSPSPGSVRDAPRGRPRPAWTRVTAFLYPGYHDVPQRRPVHPRINWSRILHPEALKVCQARASALAEPGLVHGEFEPVLHVLRPGGARGGAAGRWSRSRSRSRPGTGVGIRTGGRSSTSIRRASGTSRTRRRPIRRYVAELIALAQEAGI
jgi:hypothetical protein